MSPLPLPLWQVYMPTYHYWYTIGQARPNYGVFSTYGFIGDHYQTMDWEDAIKTGKRLRIVDYFTGALLCKYQKGTMWYYRKTPANSGGHLDQPRWQWTIEDGYVEPQQID